MNRREHHRASSSQLVDEKDHQIVQLKLALQTQITRNSLIQSRLLATLDSLDLQQLTHHDEVMELKKSRDLLKARLTRYMRIVETTEAEKNDMRDAVLQLVQRVESAKNYAALPYNHISLATPVEEVYHANHRFQSFTSLNASRNNGNDKEKDLALDLIGYAPSVIANLRLERDNERKAHEQTRSELEARIWALEAMVSRRESELEFLIAQPNGEPEDQKNVAGPSMNPREQQLEEDVISMLDVIVLRNRKLDSEIRSLAKKLENARARAAHGRRSRENSTSRPPSRSTNPVPISQPHSGVAALHSPLLSKTNLEELEDDLRDLDSKITSFAAERRAIQRDLALSHNPRHVDVAVGTETGLHVDSEGINDERDWDELVSQLEDTTRERDRLLEENEYLREELQRTRSRTAEQNEDTILAGESLFAPQDESPSTWLQDAHPMQSTPASMVVQHTQPVPTGNLLDSSLDEGEESMELATPLVPLVSLDDQSNRLETTQSTNPFNPRPQTRRSQNEMTRYQIDPASIQLPDSPEEEVENKQAEEDWDLEFANGVQLDIARFRSPPIPSPAPSGSLPGSPAISPTLTLASIRGMPASSTADLELDFSPSIIAKSTPLPALQPSPVITHGDGVQRRKPRSKPRSSSRRSSQRGSDEGRSRSASSTTSPGMSHMEMLLDGFGSDGHSVERETYEDT